MKKIEMIREIIEHLKNTDTFNNKLFVNYAYNINNWARIENKAKRQKKEYIKKIYDLYNYGYYKTEHNQKQSDFKLLYDLINY